MNIKVFFAWYDLWVGVYVDTKNKCIYICPLPMLVIRISYARTTYPRCCHCGDSVPLVYLEDNGLAFCGYEHMESYRKRLVA